MIDLAYIGGFFDADGSVSLVRTTKQSKSMEAPRIINTPQLNIGQADAGLLNEISKTIGGKVFKTSNKGDISKYGITKNRDGYSLLLSNKSAIKAAKELLPFTYSKRQELLEVILFHETYCNFTKGWARHRHINPEYYRRLAIENAAGDAVRAKLKNIRLNKDTFS